MTSEEFKEIKDIVQQLALQMRQSGTPSAVLLEMQGRVKVMDGKIDDHIKLHEVNDKKWDAALLRIEPYIKRAEDDREFRETLEQKAKHLGFWGGIWLTFAAVVASVYYGFKHIK